MDQGLEAQRQARALAAKEQEQARERQAAQLALQRERDAVPQARASSVQAGGAQAPAGKVVGSGDSAAKIRAKLAAEGKNQGFTGNMHLRVSPQEFKREMERYAFHTCHARRRSCACANTHAWTHVCMDRNTFHVPGTCPTPTDAWYRLMNGSRRWASDCEDRPWPLQERCMFLRVHRGHVQHGLGWSAGVMLRGEGAGRDIEQTGIFVEGSLVSIVLFQVQVKWYRDEAGAAETRHGSSRVIPNLHQRQRMRPAPCRHTTRAAPRRMHTRPGPESEDRLLKDAANTQSDVASSVLPSIIAKALERLLKLQGWKAPQSRRHTPYSPRRHVPSTF